MGRLGTEIDPVCETWCSTDTWRKCCWSWRRPSSPPMNVGAVAGRGRGEWRPPGISPGAPFQKNYQAGFGPPTWGSGRGFGGGGLDFTLPSHKTIFEVDIDSFEEKPWKYPGVDMADFFNFGLNEESWKHYSKQLGQHRLQTTMQSRIRVHEGVRTEQEFDPDMPPELAAATGNHDVRTENSNVGKAEAVQIDPNAPPPRPPILDDPFKWKLRLLNGYHLWKPGHLGFGIQMQSR